ncbi:MAG: hypothetical protein A2156_03505 [Deltaproteobacteria bacterium RBG_16_48_10]|nr:MAG: hypothetical protein A2156_03505 [Deltaproteobacteria bacterium RBG_16_48_10]
MSKRKKRASSSPSPIPQNIPAQPFPTRTGHLLAIGLMVAVTLVAYANTFQVPFQFDDVPNISGNDSIQFKDFSFEELKELIRQNYRDSIRFFAYTTFALNYYFGKLQVFGYHLVNLLIHLSSGIILYWFLLLTFTLPSLKERYGSKAFSLALFSALLFLSHPIQTQSVTYIVQRMASMGGMFYLLTMALYVRGRLSSGSKRYLCWSGMASSYLLGLFTKENVAILPFFIALYEFYFFQNGPLSPKRKKALTYVFGAVLLIGLLGLLVWGKRYYDVILEGYKTRDFTLTERVLTQFRVVLYYVTLLLYPAPSRLNLDYDFLTSRGLFDPPTTLVSILIVVGLIGYSIRVARRNPLLSYFVIWYFGNLAIESSIFPLEMVYEHRLYLPMVGPVVLFVVGVERGWEAIKARLRLRLKSREVRTRTRDTDTKRGWKNYPLWVWGLFLVITVLLVWGSYERNLVWRDKISLWQDAVKKSPQKSRPHYNLGLAYHEKKEYQEAIESYNRSILLKPDDPDAYNNLGLTYKAMGAYPKAIEAFQAALRMKPDFPLALNNIGLTYSETNRYQEAIDALKKAIRFKPNDPEIYNNLGVTYRKMGRLQDAIEAYQQALRIKPHPHAFNNLGLAYFNQGEFQKAIGAFQQAVLLKPNDGEFYYNLGGAYTRVGNHPAALKAYQDAIRVKPGHIKAHFNLGLTYLVLKRRDLALEQQRILSNLDQDRAEKLSVLINR